MNRILGPNDVILGHLCQHSDRVLSGWIFTNKNSHPFNALLLDAIDFCLEGKTGKIPKIRMFEKFPCLEGRNLEERKSIMNSHTWSFLIGFLFGWQKFPPQKKNLGKFKNSIEIPSWVRVSFRFAISSFRP